MATNEFLLRGSYGRVPNKLSSCHHLEFLSDHREELPYLYQLEWMTPGTINTLYISRRIARGRLLCGTTWHRLKSRNTSCISDVIHLASLNDLNRSDRRHFSRGLFNIRNPVISHAPYEERVHFAKGGLILAK